MKNAFTMSMLAIAAALLAACGNATPAPGIPEPTATAVVQPVEGDEGAGPSGLPEHPDVIDDYDDGLFKYADRGLYESGADGAADYALKETAEQSCSEMLGLSVPSVLTEVSLDEEQSTITVNGRERRYEAVAQEVVGPYDLWGYSRDEGNGVTCIAGFTSRMSPMMSNAAIDGIALACMDAASGEVCANLYTRGSPYLFYGFAAKGATDEDEGQALSPIAEAVTAALRSAVGARDAAGALDPERDATEN